MRRDIFLNGDSVLLLGEGNFSFSIGMLNLGLDLKMTATCYESVCTRTQIENSERLKSRGVCVLTGIDSTKLHEHNLIMTKKFDKIVFNFPHTGGKMKINLNRELLHLFFLSASNLLSKPRGNIIVSLCQGQGADYQGKRTWTNSWQIVEMAGHADLLLVECLPFEWASFPQYSNVGYRSLEKGFHSANAMVHRFSHVGKSLGVHVKSVIDYYQNGMNSDPVSQPIFARKMKQDILRDDTTPTFFILQNIQMLISSKFKCAYHIQNEPLLQDLQEENISLAQKLWEPSSSDFFLYSFYILNGLSMDFKQSPVTIQTLLFGNDSDKVFIAAMTDLLVNLSLTDYQIVLRECCAETEGVKKVYLQESDGVEFLLAELLYSCHWEVPESVLLIHIDILVKKLFSLQCWRQMWADCVHISYLSGKPVVAGICPYPVSYTFDLSFTINMQFTEQKLFNVLWDIAGEVLVGVTKVSEFISSDKKKSACFRMSYLSYDRPMCRKTVIDFHQNVLGRVLETVLGVSLK